MSNYQLGLTCAARSSSICLSFSRDAAAPIVVQKTYFCISRIRAEIHLIENYICSLWFGQLIFHIASRHTKASNSITYMLGKTSGRRCSFIPIMKLSSRTCHVQHKRFSPCGFGEKLQQKRSKVEHRQRTISLRGQMQRDSLPLHINEANSSQIARRRQEIMGCYRSKDLEQDPYCRINVGVRICGAEDEVQQKLIQDMKLVLPLIWQIILECFLRFYKTAVFIAYAGRGATDENVEADEEHGNPGHDEIPVLIQIERPIECQTRWAQNVNCVRKGAALPDYVRGPGVPCRDLQSRFGR